ncbi:hypothetical protein P175DRAFT_0498325 [Aspergillus ochraceoroseus IBT 24754]|uniref:Uncharacterized protein n=3 Tax=Aspergillus subgen. Nidulantes TaxID=2720870 RepID=A0A0F8UEP0_9EURO|nr:uncharacterized protein P175DRAFT_0498325 [Aspergillus ochraceoroseus IBT 24754]KKK14990.1 hypothetical protein AOCH_003421 [Aspergillus ochraceoroseus]KKK18169.1 hypothetical protein ARAM_004896 [Aspergillus rambellii]PTU25220.1 hypothetical protein P175DRAFT_0498325 [Aspergillus ochraceoroseus IBT 24754]
MSSSSSYCYSSTTSSSGGSTTTGHRYTTSSQTNPDGVTTVRTARQDLGSPVIVEEHRYDSSGQELATIPGDTLAGGVRRITDLDEEHPPRRSQTHTRNQDEEPASLRYHTLGNKSQSHGEDPFQLFGGSEADERMRAKSDMEASEAIRDSR